MVPESITGMIIQTAGLATGVATTLLDINPIFLLAGLIIVIIIVFYLIKALMKIAIVGLFSAFMVIAANLVGLNIPITFQTLITSATFGIIIFTILKYVEIGWKILKAATYPVRKAVKRKDKQKPVGENKKYSFKN